MSKTYKMSVFLVFIAAIYLSSIACAGVTQRISISSNGEQANHGSDSPSISADGKYVAYVSFADNLVTGDTNKYFDVFVYNTQTSETLRISTSSDETQANGYSYSPSIGADGRYVAFESYANNLISDDTNGCFDIFVKDTQTGNIQRVSISSDGEEAEGNNDSDSASISADGRYVAFLSSADNLVFNDTNQSDDIFVRDIKTGETQLISTSSGGVQANDDSYIPSISADGRYVAFLSYANNLVPGDTNKCVDIFVKDRQTNATQRISVSNNGVQANAYSYSPSISANGKYVTFESYANNLVAGDTNGCIDIFVRDIQTAKTELISVSSDQVQANDSCSNPSISTDGRFVAFVSAANNLVSDDTNGRSDVFVRDIKTGKTQRGSVSTNGVQANLYNYSPSISADGKLVAFLSDASNLITADTNNSGDIFIHVMDSPVTDVSLNKTTLPLKKASTETLVATVNPSDATNKSVTWSSNNTSVAAVDSSGKVSGVSGGSCKITVTTVDGSKTAECKVDVSVPVISISLNKTTLSSNKGVSETLIATVNPADATNKAVTWESSNTDVATVDSTGKVTTVGDGTSKITVTTVDGTKTANCIVNIQSMIYYTSPAISDTYDSYTKLINISGKSDASITKASWLIDSKRKGSCKVSKGTWNASKIGLTLGGNPITLTGSTKSKQTFTDTLLVNYIDNINPVVKISSPSSKPTYQSTKAVVSISGSVTDLEAIAKVTWLNAATGASGVCTGTKSWKASGAALKLGSNEITISAKDSSGNIGISKITITMVDKTKPKVAITTPTNKPSLILNTQNITLGGTASDDIEVAKVEWLNKSTGESGICSGTTAWSSTIALQIGKNNITITATDTSSNKTTDTIAITRK